MDDMQQVIGDWAEKTFPQSTITSCAEHLRREVQEFINSSNVHKSWDAEELADCQLILMHIAHKMNVSLEYHTLLKYAKNQNRQWGQPDADGVVEHLRAA